MKAISAVVLLAGFCAPAQQPPPAASVEGTVVNSVTGAGIAGASVTLARGRVRVHTNTDLAGGFRVTGLTPGNYRASAEKDGFAPPRLELPLPLADSGIRVSGGDPVKIELKLTALNSIRGRVLDPDGKPAAGIEVTLNPNLPGAEVTDKDGLFALQNVKPGSYTLIARPPGNVRPVEAPDGSRIAMITTYYPSVADPSLAQPIVFRGEGDLDRFDMYMQRAPVHRVRGIVLDETGKPSPRAELSLFHAAVQGAPEAFAMAARAGGTASFAVGLRRAPCCTPEARLLSGPDGRFEFTAVPSGDWRMNAESDPLRDETHVVAKASAGVVVGRADVDDLEIRLAMPFKLNGTVEWKGDAANPQGNPVTVTLLNADTNEYAAGGVSDSGRLVMERLLPGHYKALAMPGFAAQFLLGDNDVTGQTFRLNSGEPPLRVILKPWFGTVRGTVEKGGGATVVLLPDTGGQVAFAQMIACGDAGSFEMSGVSPGDYYLAAFDRPFGMTPSPAMLALIPSRGVRVKVEEHGAASVTLSVISTPR